MLRQCLLIAMLGTAVLAMAQAQITTQATAQAAEPPASAPSSPTEPDPGALLELNEAERADLESLAGIGPGLASRLLLARKARPFANWADLQRRVPGVGPKLALGLSRQGLRVQGQAYRPAS